MFVLFAVKKWRNYESCYFSSRSRQKAAGNIERITKKYDRDQRNIVDASSDRELPEGWDKKLCVCSRLSKEKNAETYPGEIEERAGLVRC